SHSVPALYSVLLCYLLDYFHTLTSKHTSLWTLSFCGTPQFYVVNERLNWTEAQKYCRENFTDLATIENQEDMNAVKSALNGASDYFWIGLRQNPEQNSVSICEDLEIRRKLNGSTICYQNWAPGNGTGVEDCRNGERSGAVQSGSKQWISLLENQTLNFICTESDGETRTSNWIYLLCCTVVLNLISVLSLKAVFNVTLILREREVLDSSADYICLLRYICI
uniref:C-type lectin domain-containing protein n=1 Tax=Astyanax mexicanus TaxID=7994 RepID=A0A3B1IME7_ASTMX